MKKVAFICELIGTKREGGENLAMLRMANSLRKKGLQVDVFSYTSKDPRLKINSIIPLKLRLLPFIREILFMPLIGMRLLKKIEKEYDAVFASTMTIASLYKPKNVLIITCHLIRSQKFKNLSKIRKYKILFNPLTYLIMSSLERKSLLNASKIIVIRDQQIDYLRKKLRVERNKISLIPNGIDVSFFRSLKLKKKNQIIFVGRGTIPKGVDILLDAADKIKADILIVTKKIDKKFSQIAKTKPNVKIIYNASPVDIVKLYSESRIFVLPSINEEQPLSTMEAMACGLPVVVTKDAAADLVENNINGFIIPARNSFELGNRVNQLLNDPHLSTSMSERNIKRIREYYNLEKISEKTKELIYV